jgi:hypothetical protein
MHLVSLVGPVKVLGCGIKPSVKGMQRKHVVWPACFCWSTSRWHASHHALPDGAMRLPMGRGADALQLLQRHMHMVLVMELRLLPQLLLLLWSQ